MEILPNELLLELFQYLDATELFRAFWNLNNRFDTLLFTHFRLYHVNFHSFIKYQTDFLSRHVIPLITNQIISIRLSDNEDNDPSQTNFFLSSGLEINQFIHLRSLVLCHIYNDTILCNILDDCCQLAHLTHLKVVAKGEGVDGCRVRVCGWIENRLTLSVE